MNSSLTVLLMTNKTGKNVSSFFTNDNILGWVSNSQLSDKAFGIVIVDEEIIFKFPELKSKKIARIKKNFVIRIKKCSVDWCFVEEGEIRGWIPKKSFWGFKN